MEFDDFDKWLRAKVEGKVRVEKVDSQCYIYSVVIGDKDVMRIEAGPDTEIYKIKFRDFFYDDIAYSVEEKRQALSNLKIVLGAILDGGYHIKKYSLNGKVLKKELYLDKKAEAYNNFYSSVSLKSRLLLLFFRARIMVEEEVD